MRRSPIRLALVVVVTVAMGHTAIAQPTYTQVLEQMFGLHCLSYHSSNLSGVARNSVPEGVDFDTFADATSNNNAINANILVQAEIMPRRPFPENTPIPLPQGLKDLMQAWATGGFFLIQSQPLMPADPPRSTKAKRLLTTMGVYMRMILNPTPLLC